MNDQTAFPPGVDRSLNTRRYAVYGALFGFAFPVVAIGISLAVNRLPISVAAILALHVNQPLLWIIDTAPFFLGSFASLAGARQDAVQGLNLRLHSQTNDLVAAQRLLEQRVAQRTAELEDRNRELRQAILVTRRISRIRDSAELAQQAVRLVADNYIDFGVDLYLTDERRAEVVLVAASEALAPGDVAARTRKVSDASLIGQVAGSGDAGRSLTGTYGPELALPLLSRGLPVGVLHVHPLHEGVLLPADTELLQLIADQLASALETARSSRDAGEALEELRSVSGQAVQTAWRRGLVNETLIYEYTPAGTRPLRAPPLDAGRTSLRVPVELRGQRIGSIVLRRKDSTYWADADRDLAAKTADQVALALENVRLLDETRQRAQSEQLLSEFSARLNQSVSLESLLQTAVRELAALPEVAGASIYLRPEAGPLEQSSQRPGTGD